MKTTPPKKQGPSLGTLLKPYMKFIILLIVLAIGSNGLSLVLPQLIAHAIDTYTATSTIPDASIWYFSLAVLGILLLTFGQSIIQTYASEKVARDLREDLAAKISRQSYLYIQNTNPSKLLTNLTSDIDSIKLFVSQIIVSMVSSFLLIIGSAIFLLMIDWQLALLVLMIIPLIGGAFFFIFKRIGALFLKAREVIDWLNKVINESILGAALIRVLHAEKMETAKFNEANTQATSVGLQILTMFATLIPIIVFVSSMASVVILVLGGYFVIGGVMTLGDFTAFNSYLGILVFPIIMIGFMSNMIAQASTSYHRISEVLEAEEKEPEGVITKTLQGKISVENISLNYGEKKTLKNISFEVAPGSRTAILGPTAAGKSQLLYLMTGLNQPSEGRILYDDQPISDYDPISFHKQVGFVFQDSVIFNMSIRENIAFSSDSTEEDLQKAIKTAELEDFITSLPEGLETIVSERGASLSGGQKQRIMLARALTLNPRILLLDDFTARVDTQTEQKILENMKKYYPDLTLVSITQKVAAIESYEQILLLMEGELLTSGTHKELLHTSPEYVQIYNSQKSTNHYEL
ncbi:MAG: ABC transporter ATP-binding protein [Candidatus Gracilibacteria bacterium]